MCGKNGSIYQMEWVYCDSDSVQDIYWEYESLMSHNVIEHVPLITEVVETNSLSYINEHFRNSTNVKHIFKKKYSRKKKNAILINL